MKSSNRQFTALSKACNSILFPFDFLNAYPRTSLILEFQCATVDAVTYKIIPFASEKHI